MARGLSAWQATIARAAREQWDLPRVAVGDPLSVSMVFRMPRPRSRRQERWHAARPDIDKLIRAVLDGLSGIVYDDDCTIARIIAVALYETDERPPGVTISVRLCEEDDEHDPA